MGAAMNEAQGGDIKQWLRQVAKDKREESRSRSQDRGRNSRSADYRSGRHVGTHKAHHLAMSRRAAERAKRVRPRVSIGGLLFWFPKGFALATVPPGVYVLLLLSDGHWRGPVTAMIFTLFAVGWSLRQGLSRRQWRKQDLTGLNEAIALSGKWLMWLAAAIVAGWSILGIGELLVQGGALPQ